MRPSPVAGERATCITSLKNSTTPWKIRPALASWIASAGNSAKAKQITTKEFAVGGFSWTPDGRIILASQDGNLYAVNQDGSGRIRLTPDGSPNWDPSVCGDGRYIVYAAYREQKRGIWRMSADGSNPIRIADETFAIGPQCSPDGKWVVYVRGPSWTPVKVPITGAKPPEVFAQTLEVVFIIFSESPRTESESCIPLTLRLKRPRHLLRLSQIN